MLGLRSTSALQSCGECCSLLIGHANKSRGNYIITLYQDLVDQQHLKHTRRPSWLCFIFLNPVHRHRVNRLSLCCFAGNDEQVILHDVERWVKHSLPRHRNVSTRSRPPHIVFVFHILKTIDVWMMVVPTEGRRWTCFCTSTPCTACRSVRSTTTCLPARPTTDASSSGTPASRRARVSGGGAWAPVTIVIIWYWDAVFPRSGLQGM